jgi:hypothetical protein
MRLNQDLEKLIILALLIAGLIWGVYLISSSGNSKGEHEPYKDKPLRPHFDTNGDGNK